MAAGQPGFWIAGSRNLAIGKQNRAQQRAQHIYLLYLQTMRFLLFDVQIDHRLAKTFKGWEDCAPSDSILITYSKVGYAF